MVPLRYPSLLIALSVVNLCILCMVLLREAADAAAVLPSDGILRGRGLQISDDEGRIRASIAISPIAPQPDGSVYPETVLFRLITAEGRPVVKIASAEDGAVMTLSAAAGLSYVQLVSRGSDPGVVIVDGAGRQTAALP